MITYLKAWNKYCKQKIIFRKETINFTTMDCVYKSCLVVKFSFFVHCMHSVTSISPPFVSLLMHAKMPSSTNKIVSKSLPLKSRCKSQRMYTIYEITTPGLHSQCSWASWWSSTVRGTP